MFHLWLKTNYVHAMTYFFHKRGEAQITNNWIEIWTFLGFWTVSNTFYKKSLQKYLIFFSIFMLLIVTCQFWSVLVNRTWLAHTLLFPLLLPASKYQPSVSSVLGLVLLLWWCFMDWGVFRFLSSLKLFCFYLRS